MFVGVPSGCREEVLEILGQADGLGNGKLGALRPGLDPRHGVWPRAAKGVPLQGVAGEGQVGLGPSQPDPGMLQ